MVCAPAQAARVVSLNLCTDQMLVLLSPDSVVALSKLARDPALSVVAEAASRFATVRPDAEAVLALHPGLVLAGAYGAQTLLTVLRGRGVRVVQVDDPADFAGVAAEVTELAGGARREGARGGDGRANVVGARRFGRADTGSCGAVGGQGLFGRSRLVR